MSLLVHKCFLIEDDWDIVDEPDYSRELAGFETWRNKLYGSAIAIKLGCKILPQLRKHDIYCFGEDVPQLLKDCQIMLEHLSLIGLETQIDEEVIEFRVGNIRAATEWALANGGGVVVW